MAIRKIEGAAPNETLHQLVARDELKNGNTTTVLLAAMGKPDTLGYDFAVASLCVLEELGHCKEEVVDGHRVFLFKPESIVAGILFDVREEDAIGHPMDWQLTQEQNGYFVYGHQNPYRASAKVGVSTTSEGVPVVTSIELFN